MVSFLPNPLLGMFAIDFCLPVSFGCYELGMEGSPLPENASSSAERLKCTLGSC